MTKTEQMSAPPSDQQQLVAIYDNATMDKNDKQHCINDKEKKNDLTTGTIFKTDNCDRIGLLVFTSLFTFFFCGAFLGWGPMQLILEEDRAFEWKCGEGEEIPCSDQSKSLLIIPMIAYSCAVVFSPLMGYLSDSRGPLALMIFLGVSGCIGIGLITIASAVYDQLYSLGFIFIGFMFIGVSIIIQPTGLVFQDNEKAQRLVISILHALIDAGSVTYLLLYHLVTSTNISPIQTFVGYLVFAILSFAGGIYYWYRITKTGAYFASDSVSNEDGKDMSKNGPADIQEGNDSNKKASLIMNDKRKSESNRRSSSSSSTDCDLISNRAPIQQLKSSQFILVLTFFMSHVVRANFTLQAAREYLGSLGDDEENNKYLTIFSSLNAASLVGIPFIEWILSHKGYHAGFQLVNIMALVHGTIQVSSENMNVQVLGFIIYSFYRCYLFSVVFSYLPLFLSGQVVGRASGVMFICTSMLSTTNIGLSRWAVNQDYNFWGPNLLYTVMVAPMIIVAWFIGKGIRREAREKTKQQQVPEEAQKRMQFKRATTAKSSASSSFASGNIDISSDVFKTDDGEQVEHQTCTVSASDSPDPESHLELCL